MWVTVGIVAVYPIVSDSTKLDSLIRLCWAVAAVLCSAALLVAVIQRRI